MALYRIETASYADYTGELGGVNFENGVTVREYPEAFIDRLAANYAIVNAETGAPAGLLARMANISAIPYVPTPVLEQMTEAQIATANLAAVAKVVKTLNVEFYTLEQLQAVVDAKGIAGLREIAEPYGVRGRSIIDLLDAVLKAQDMVRASRGTSGGTPGHVVETNGAPPQE